MGGQFFLFKLLRGNFEDLQRIPGPADLIGKGGHENRPEMKIPGYPACEQRNAPALPGGGARRGFRRKTVTQLRRFLQYQIPGALRNGAAAVKNLGDRVSGQSAGIGDILHGDAFGRHKRTPLFFRIYIVS